MQKFSRENDHAFFENWLKSTFHLIVSWTQISTCDMFEIYSVGPALHLKINIKEFDFQPKTMQIHVFRKSLNTLQFCNNFTLFYLWNPLWNRKRMLLCFIMPITYWGHILKHCIWLLNCLRFKKVFSAKWLRNKIHDF